MERKPIVCDCEDCRKYHGGYLRLSFFFLALAIMLALWVMS